MLPKLDVYIDGSSRPNTTKAGAFAVLFIKPDGGKYSISQRFEDVTNNQMELMALISALEFIKEYRVDKDFDIEVFGDSQYVINGLQKWLPSWKANKFRTSTKKPVKNLELWKKLDELKDQVNCKLTWVKGHANNQYNEEVDKIAHELSS